MYTDLTNLCIAQDKSIRQAIAQMDISRIGIVLVVDEERRLQGTITDGDVRREVLTGSDLDQPVTELLARKVGSHYATPITAPLGADSVALLSLLQENRINHIPLVDQDERVEALARMADFLPEQESPIKAVIMAGGLGLRMRPLTEELPKPMLSVGDRPVLETIVDQLRSTGIKHISIAVNHKLEKIIDHFGDGQDFGVDISYTTEDRPLGTAGALGLLKKPDDTTLVINGDILTRVDFRAMLAFHHEHQAELTIAVARHESQIPYGVVECEGAVVRELSEKPLMSFFINAGIYLLEPASHSLIPNGKPYDMTDLIARLLKENRTVVAFPIREYWIDIGQIGDYQQAQIDFPGVGITQ